MRVKYENSGIICNQQYNFAGEEGKIKVGDFEITEEGGNSFLSFPINNNDARLEEVAKLIALDSEKQGDIVKIPLKKVTITTSGNVAFKLSSAKGRGSLATNFTITPNSVKTSSQEIVVVPSGKVMDVTLPSNFFQLFLGKSNDRFKVEGALPVEFFTTLFENKKFFDNDKVISATTIMDADRNPIPIVKIGDDSYLAVNSKMRKVESVSRIPVIRNGVRTFDINFTFKNGKENVARRVQGVNSRKQDFKIRDFMGIKDWWDEKYIDKKPSVATEKLTENILQKKTASNIKQVSEEEQNFNAVTPDEVINPDNDNKDLEEEINGLPSGGNPLPPDVTGNNKKPAESEQANVDPAPEDEIDEPAKNITGEDQNQNPKDEEEKPVSDKAYVYPSRGKYLAMGILLGAFALIGLFAGLAGLLSMCVAFGSLAVGMGTVMGAEVTADAGAGRMEVSLAGKGKPSRIKFKDREARKEKSKEAEQAKEKAKEKAEEAKQAKKGAKDKADEAKQAMKGFEKKVKEGDQAKKEAKEKAEEAQQAKEEAIGKHREAEQAREEAKEKTAEAKQAVKEAREKIAEAKQAEEKAEKEKTAEAKAEKEKKAEEAQQAKEEAVRKVAEAKQAKEEVVRKVDEAKQAVKEAREKINEAEHAETKVNERALEAMYIYRGYEKKAEEAKQAKEEAVRKADEAKQANKEARKKAKQAEQKEEAVQVEKAVQVEEVERKNENQQRIENALAAALVLQGSLQEQINWAEDNKKTIEEQKRKEASSKNLDDDGRDGQ